MATSLIRGDWLYWPSLAFRTETLQRIDFREGLPIIQDLALLMDIAFEGGTLAYNPTLAFSYRRHGGSASQKTLLDGRRFRDERTYYAEARRLAVAHGWRAHRTRRRVLRVMSRLHAITELPEVLRGGNRVRDRIDAGAHRRPLTPLAGAPDPRSHPHVRSRAHHRAAPASSARASRVASSTPVTPSRCSTR